MNCFIVEAKRTPIGRAHKDKGIFRNVRADELVAHLLNYFSKNVVAANQIDDIYLGCVAQHLEQGKNIARLSALLAGLPNSVPGVTFNRLCGSSLQALNSAAHTIHAGEAQAILAGGVEHMHHLPMTSQADYHKSLMERYEFPFNNMGLTAERVAKQYQISRREQDQFSLVSHQRATQAWERGFFDKEVLSLVVEGETVKRDQGPRATTTLEALAELKPAFIEETGTVTPGNSSQLSDGASLMLVASETFCQKQQLKKRARVRGSAVVGLDPLVMGLGPIPAVQKLLKNQKLSIKEIGLFEVNEAFASQSLACLRDLELDPERVNVSGGAIALGHPLGCTGTRLVTTLLHNMERLDQQFGIATMCIGHGQGIATLIERV